MHGCRGSPPAAHLAPVGGWTRHSVCFVCVARGGSRELSLRRDIFRVLYALGPEKAMFVGPGSKCRVDLYKSETRMLKDVFSALGRTILRGRYTPNISSNSSPKPRN